MKVSPTSALIGGAAMLIGVLVTGLFVLPTPGEYASASSFIVLLVILIVALSATAIVFGGLELTNSSEAFGLPSGSIRTLLAIGIMILFAVFGLASLTGSKQLTKINEVKVDSKQVKKEVVRYEAAQLVVVVETVGSPAVPASGAVAEIPAVEGKLVLYSKTKEAGAADLEKQILTAIITLLTSVVGFYFGSKSAAEGARAVTDAGKPTVPDMQELLTQVSGQELRLKDLEKAAEPSENQKKALAVLQENINKMTEARKNALNVSLAAADRIKAYDDLKALSAAVDKQLVDFPKD